MFGSSETAKRQKTGGFPRFQTPGCKQAKEEIGDTLNAVCGGSHPAVLPVRKDEVRQLPECAFGPAAPTDQNKLGRRLCSERARGGQPLPGEMQVQRAASSASHGTG